jgi:glucose-1-phosphate adenylyltransferase
MDLFSHGFVEILAAEQTPDNPNWYQGTADAVRQAVRHFVRYHADYYLILAGDHLYRMDYSELVDAHIDRNADITIAAQSVTPDDASGMGIFRFDHGGHIVAFEEKPNRDRPMPSARAFRRAQRLPATHQRNRSSPRWESTCSRAMCCRGAERDGAADFGHEIIPRAIEHYRVNSYLFRGYWADIGTVPAFYEANMLLARPDAPFNFYDPRRPIYTHPRFLPGSRLSDCSVRRAIVAEGCHLDRCTIADSVIGIRTEIQAGAQVRRSLVVGADFYEADDDATTRGDGPRLGVGRDVVLDRVIVDKNARIGDGARLVNEAGVRDLDGPGYYVRNGFIIVPKDGVIQAGVRV